jgi:hypothetical protein
MMIHDDDDDDDDDDDVRNPWCVSNQVAVTRQPTGQGMWDKADYVELTEARAYISI